MKEFLVNNFDMFITILGFFVTYKLTTKTFGNEIRKSKIDQNIEAIHSLPLELCNMMSKIQKSRLQKNSVTAEEYEDLITKIFAYGSKDSVALAIEIQQTFYKVAKTNDDCGQYLLVLFSLLITQLKYEISDEIISPESWFKLKINDYDNVRENFVNKINHTVKKLGLSKKFTIKE